MFRGRKDREQNKNRHRGTAANNNQAPQPPHQSKRIRARGSESTGRLLDASIHSNISTDASKHVRRSTVDRVSFTTIEIREYARTLGDNPSCTSGPPVSYVSACDHLLDLRVALTQTITAFQQDFMGVLALHLLVGG